MKAFVQGVLRILAGIVFVALVCFAPSAVADDRDDRGTGSQGQVQGSAGPRAFDVAGKVHEKKVDKPSRTGAGSSVAVTDSVTYVYEPGCDASSHGSDGCIEMVCVGGGLWTAKFPVINGVKDVTGVDYFCADKATAQAPTVNSSAVLREVKRIGLPSGKLSVQPPGGRTLVNFDTIFSTTAEEITRTITVAGIPVRVRIWPSAYTWHWGDESDPLPTDEPGRPYERGLSMDEYITHQYVDADVTVRPRVDVTYSAEFSVRGGDWQQVDGTVPIQGNEVSVQVVEAKPVLTGSR